MSRTRTRSGFTLVEAVVSMSITAMAGSALLLGVSSSLKSANDLEDQTLASGIARQLLDEVLGRRYAAIGAGPYQTDLGPNSTEQAGPGRSKFDDIDDYDGFSAKPPKDLWGIVPGLDNGVGGTRHANFQAYPNYLDNWRETISVYYVSNSDPRVKLTGTQTSDYRAVEVNIYLDDPIRGNRLLATERRVIANVPNH